MTGQQGQGLRRASAQRGTGAPTDAQLVACMRSDDILFCEDLCHLGEGGAERRGDKICNKEVQGW